MQLNGFKTFNFSDLKLNWNIMHQYYVVALIFYSKFIKKNLKNVIKYCQYNQYIVDRSLLFYDCFKSLNTREIVIYTFVIVRLFIVLEYAFFGPATDYWNLLLGGLKLGCRRHEMKRKRVSSISRPHESRQPVVAFGSVCFGPPMR